MVVVVVVVMVMVMVMGGGNADEPHLQSCALIVHPVRVQLKAPAIRNQ